jgi:erythronate-4-phosphate dehydrogenase
MKIVADDNITGIAEHCSDLGEITFVDGRNLRRAELQDAEILLVRSVTRVDAKLLNDTPIRYVGSATAGIDHIDTDYLASRGIHFTATFGCNAVAVAEYVTACVLAHCLELGLNPAGLTAGIIGCGHTGTAVTHHLAQLGINCLRNDPPRAMPAPRDYCSLESALRADVVTLHVPLTAEGPWATEGLVGRDEIAQLSPQALLINAARGKVLDESAWIQQRRPTQRLVLDCWIDEPRIALDLLDTCWIATPHIAGHTIDARLRATALLANDLRTFLGRPPVLNVAPDSAGMITLDPERSLTALELTAKIVMTACNPKAYSRDMRGLKTAGAELGARFDALRRRFGRRREFSAYQVNTKALDPATRLQIAGLGFTCAA